MPARSRSQQRLFGMVHAYNKGEFHGSRSLRNRVAALSNRISDEDARHFAQTPHSGLPETKEAQVLFHPEDVQAAYDKINPTAYAGAVVPRSERRRSFLSHVLSGMAVGTLVGGAGMTMLGAFLGDRATRGNTTADPEAVRRSIQAAALKCGLWGASRGAVSGAIAGAGLGVLDKIRS